MDASAPTPKTTPVWTFVLNGLHIVLAAVLVLISLLNHGRVPGLSADSSAALGFVLIIGFGLPLALTAIGTAVWSVVTKDKWLNVLGASLFITALVLMEGWSGVAAPLIYLYLFIAVWTMVQRLRRRT